MNARLDAAFRYLDVRYSERELAGEGEQAIYQHSKVAHPMDALLTRLGYERIDTIWAKRLDRG